MNKKNLFLAAIMLCSINCGTTLQSAGLAGITYRSYVSGALWNKVSQLTATTPTNMVGTLDVEPGTISKVTITVTHNNAIFQIAPTTWDATKTAETRNAFITGINSQLQPQNQGDNITVNFSITATTPNGEHTLAPQTQVTLAKTNFSVNLWEHAIAPFLTLKQNAQSKMSALARNENYTTESYNLALTHKEFPVSAANVAATAALAYTAYHGLSNPWSCGILAAGNHFGIANRIPVCANNPAFDFGIKNNTQFITGTTQETLNEAKEAWKIQNTKQYRQLFEVTPFTTIKNNVSNLTFSFATDEPTTKKIGSNAVRKSVYNANVLRKHPELTKNTAIGLGIVGTYYGIGSKTALTAACAYGLYQGCKLTETNFTDVKNAVLAILPSLQQPIDFATRKAAELQTYLDTLEATDLTTDSGTDITEL